jgi:hypothetical protein
MRRLGRVPFKGKSQPTALPPSPEALYHSATIIVSPKPAVARDGIISAEAHFHIIAPAVISDLGRDTAQAWDEILAGRAGHSGTALRELITAALARHSVLPSQVLDRLTPEPVASRLD